MSKNTPKAGQLQLFPLDDYRIDKAQPIKPAPLQTADKFRFALQHYEPTNDNQEYLYAIQDWIAGLLGKKDIRQVLADLKRNTDIFETLDSIQPLNYIASDGKTYQRDFTNAKGLYLIAQTLRVTKARPQLKEIREFLASSAAWVELIGRDKNAATVAIQGLAKHHSLRLESIAQRKDLTATIKLKSRRFTPKLIGLATNTMYSKLFRVGNEYTAKREIVAILELSDSQARNLRDNLNVLALSAVRMAEEAATIKLNNSSDGLSDSDILAIIKQCARIAASSAHELAAYAGVDLLTNRPALRD